MADARANAVSASALSLGIGPPVADDFGRELGADEIDLCMVRCFPESSPDPRPGHGYSSLCTERAELITT
ncbi:protein of unknown function [Magnetospirillum gryphiswaldense MSR-1 v2]|uniref:Uncharacterized protein n=1 Tax=Magnetospirillum gryphiswaldense (strain DSM 6361 / JCM 21280 / NBRC 15271 / MSR-1) TaxID=431944 RepID=V6F391_MAGGM|nr:protein of unknown function [Magnetospirillum gryphiswaldense MSR-1 v2]